MKAAFLHSSQRISAPPREANLLSNGAGKLIKMTVSAVWALFFFFYDWCGNK